MTDNTFICANPDCDESRNPVPWTASGYGQDERPKCPWCSAPMQPHVRPDDRIDYSCRHWEETGADTAVISAPHLCPSCAAEELQNPFQGECGFHVHTVDIQNRTAGPEQGWHPDKEQARDRAAALQPTVRATVESCPGPRSCPQDSHGSEWLKKIAHLAYLHEAHGSGWSTVSIDDYDAASDRELAAA